MPETNGKKRPGRMGRLRSYLPEWRPVLIGMGIVCCGFAAGGLLFIWIGLAPVSASASHWDITRWFLEFSLRNAVEIRSAGITVPAIDDKPGLVLKGAGHYATGCAPCHGAPGQAQSLIVFHMTPITPYLPSVIGEWTTRELFWIVRNGIKYTAMPAWPSRVRDDEVWAMVAFLQQLPGMSVDRYKQLAYGDVSADPAGRDMRALAAPAGSVLADCARCHGYNGSGRGPGVFPKLAGQNKVYLADSLNTFAHGQRHSGIMQAVTAVLDEETLNALAEYYANRKPFDPSSLSAPLPADAGAAIERGRIIAEQGVRQQNVPSCVHCHGRRTDAVNPHYPSLAGQYVEYLKLQLTLFKEQRRGGGDYAHLMQRAAAGLTGAQINDVALYYASLPWEMN